MNRVASLPATMAVPMLVAVLMILVAAGVSKVVLLRLAETQETQFSLLTGAYLDGLSTALQPHVIRRDAWEAFDVIDRAKDKYSGVRVTALLVILPDETVLAALAPATHPLGSAAPVAADPKGTRRDLADAGDRVWIHRALVEGGARIGRIAAEIDVAGIHAVRSETLRTLVLVNGALTALFAVLGWMLVRRMLRPLALLSSRLAEAREGRLAPIAEMDLPQGDTDVGRAYRHYNAAAHAIAEREALLRRLGEEERKALVGRFASAVAHEVNNPLGGLFNAVRMIQRHGEDRERRERAAHLIERGLTGIHNVVRAQLMLWRGEGERRDLAGGDVEDLRFLIESEARRRDLVLDWLDETVGGAPVPAQIVRQVALNLLLNACAASPPGGRVRFRVGVAKERLDMVVADEGPGLPADARAALAGAPPSQIPAATGLGLWIVARLVAEQGGSIEISDGPGTSIHVRLPHAANRNDLPAVA
jgi:signal transduction histidine kinase